MTECGEPVVDSQSWGVRGEAGRGDVQVDAQVVPSQCIDAQLRGRFLLAPRKWAGPLALFQPTHLHLLNRLGPPLHLAFHRALQERKRDSMHGGVQTSRKVISWTRGYLQKHRRSHALESRTATARKRPGGLQWAPRAPCCLRLLHCVHPQHRYTAMVGTAAERTPHLGCVHDVSNKPQRLCTVNSVRSEEHALDCRQYRCLTHRGYTAGRIH